MKTAKWPLAQVDGERAVLTASITMNRRQSAADLLTVSVARFLDTRH
jgi:hypothetical protein